MLILIFVLSISVFIRTVSYAKYELIQNQNKSGAIIIFILAIIALICPSLFWLIT